MPSSMMALPGRGNRHVIVGRRKMRDRYMKPSWTFLSLWRSYDNTNYGTKGL